MAQIETITASGASLDHGDVKSAIEANAADAEARLSLMEDVTSVTKTIGATQDYALTDNMDGTLDWTYIDTETYGLRMEDTPAKEDAQLHVVKAQYVGIALSVEGNTEKQTFDLNLRACDQGVYELVNGNGSPDTNYYKITGQRCRRLFTSGYDSSCVLDLNFETPMDLGHDITLFDDTVVPDPRVYVTTGKAMVMQGVVRSHNGRLFCLVDRQNSGTFGTDTIIFKDFTMIDNPYGTGLWVRRCTGALIGHWIMRNCHDGRQNFNSTTTNIASPAVRLDAVSRSDFRVTITDSDNDCGLHIGDATADLSPAAGFTMLNNAISMASPGSSCALRIEKIGSSFLQFGLLEGNIELGENCNGVVIQVPPGWYDTYSVTAHASAVYSIIDLEGNVLESSNPIITDYIEVTVGDETTALTTGTGKHTFRMPYAFTVAETRANVTTAPTGDTLIVDINEGGASILSTKLSIDAGEKTSKTAATPAVMSDADLADDAEITVDIDQIGSSVAGAGLKILLLGQRA